MLASGVGAWSAEETPRLPEKRTQPRVGRYRDRWLKVVSLSTERMTDPDLKAITTLPEVPVLASRTIPKRCQKRTLQWSPEPPSTAISVQPAHGIDGKGIAELFPSIADSSMVKSDDPTTSIRIVAARRPKRRDPSPSRRRPACHPMAANSTTRRSLRCSPTCATIGGPAAAPVETADVGASAIRYGIATGLNGTVANLFVNRFAGVGVGAFLAADWRSDCRPVKIL